MSERDTIEEKLRKKGQEVAALEEKLRAAKIYVQALEDILKALDEDGGSSAERAPREGSMVAQARDIILKVNKPVHLDDLLKALGKPVTRETKASLTSQIAAYVRRGELFTRPAPNTFGLVEFGERPQERAPQPPANFGRSAPPKPASPPPPKPKGPFDSHEDFTRGGDFDDEIPF